MEERRLKNKQRSSKIKAYYQKMLKRMEQLPSHKKYQLSYKINLDNRTSLVTIKLKQETQGTAKWAKVNSKGSTQKEPHTKLEK